jgi:AcrR family transcriptional regulator
MTSRERGRPPMSSVTALEDAATELFLEQGYQNTSIDEIARRAGISRATFFNYCTTKSDVLWVDVDRALQSLDTLLGSAMPLREALETVVAAAPAGADSPRRSQSEAMGLGDELAASAGVRLERLRRSIAGSGVEQKDVWLVWERNRRSSAELGSDTLSARGTCRATGAPAPADPRGTGSAECGHPVLDCDQQR